MTSTAPPSIDPRWPWVRDFTFVGAVTGFLAPFAVIREVAYSSVTGLGGAVSGAALGVFSSWLLSGAGRRWPKLVFVPVGLLLGALWGVSSALATAFTPARHLLAVSVVVAGIAGALQLGWFWLAYSLRRVNRRSTWGVVLLASLLGGGLGLASLGTLAILH